MNLPLPHLRRPKWMLALLLCVTLFALLMHLHRPRTASLSTRFTVQQVLDESESICRAVAPHSGSLRLAAQSIPQRRDPGWEVACTDEHGNDIASLLWDAQTGTLVTVSVLHRSAQVHHAVLTTSTEALRAARTWLVALRLSEANPVWHFSCRACKLGDYHWWIVECVGSRRHISLSLDAATGDLNYASTIHPEAGASSPETQTNVQ